MIRVDINGGSIVVRLSGWDRFFSLRKSVRVPLDAVTSVRPAPDLIRARPRGLRWPGAAWPFRPGPLFEGSFIGRDQRWTFWAVRRPAAGQMLKIEADDRAAVNRYRLLVLQVHDPVSDTRRIQTAIDDLRSAEDR